MASKIFVYWASGSPPCWRVMLALEEKGVPYESKLLQFSKNEQKSEEVLKWNPRGQLPTVVFDNTFAVNESIAVIELIEKMYPTKGTSLIPEDVKDLGKVLQRKYELINLEKKGGDVIVYKVYKQGTTDGVIDPVKAKKLIDDFMEELKVWEKYASESDYIAGSKLTLTDLALFPELALFVRMGLDLQKYAPNLFNYYNRMVKKPSVEKTWPPHWKEPASSTDVFA
jgi:glutathione S-transferase